MITTLIILAITVVLFIYGKIRSDLVALGAMIALMVFKIVTPEEAISGFSSPVIVVMVGIFVVSGAVVRTGLANVFGSRILRVAGNNETALYFVLMGVTAVIGAFISNTGTVALMIPIVVSMTTTASINPRRYLMPLAFMSGMGGMLTLVGTPPNMVISGILVKAGYPALKLFSFLPVGLVCVFLGTGCMLVLSKVFLAGGKRSGQKKNDDNNLTLAQLVEKYNLRERLFKFRVVSSSLAVGKNLKELALPQDTGASVVGIHRLLPKRLPFGARKTENIYPTPDSVLSVNDVLYVTTTADKVQLLEQKFGLEQIISTEKRPGKKGSSHSHHQNFSTSGVAELVLLSSSDLVNRSVVEAKIRENYSVSVLGLRRKNEYLLDDLKNRKMNSGDALLVQGRWDAIERLEHAHKDWVVVGRPFEELQKYPLDEKAFNAGIIMLLMVAAMALNLLPAVTAILLAALATVLFGCFKNVEEAYSSINWQSVVLISSMMSVAIAFEKTGLASMLSTELISKVGGHSPYLLLTAIYAITSIITLFISNTASALLIAPLAMQVAKSLEYSPYPFLFAVTVSATMCFASPFSSPPNALVMTAGRYTFKDYLVVGLPLQIIFAVVMVAVLPIIFPFGQ